MNDDFLKVPHFGNNGSRYDSAFVNVDYVEVEHDDDFLVRFERALYTPRVMTFLRGVLIIGTLAYLIILLFSVAMIFKVLQMGIL